MVFGERKIDQQQPSPESCRKLFEQQEYLRGLTEWFSLPQEVRDAFIDRTIQAGFDAPEESLYSLLRMQDDQKGALGKDDRWILTNFAVLISPTTQALLDPDSHEPLVIEGQYNDFNDYTAFYAQKRFTELVDQKRKTHITKLQEEEGLSLIEAKRRTPKLSADSGEAADFLAPNEFIRHHFSVEEMRSFINSVLDKTPPTRDLADTLTAYDRGVVDAVQHQELILDETLLDRMPPRSLPKFIKDSSLGELTANSLRLEGPLPSVDLLEKYIALKPDDLKTGSFICWNLDGRQVPVPHGAIYMALIRRLVHNQSSRGELIESGADVLAKVTDYLASAVFTKQLMPYIASDAKFNDVLWRGKGSPRFEILHTFQNRQPQDVKCEWLQEVIDIVVTHLVETGDEETAELVLANTTTL